MVHLQIPSIYTVIISLPVILGAAGDSRLGGFYGGCGFGYSFSYPRIVVLVHKGLE